MRNPLQKVTVAAAGAVLGLVAIHANPTQAATVAYDFMVSTSEGTFEGSFDYDDESLLGTGFEQTGLSSFMFNFLDGEYTEADVPDAMVEFDGGSFQGLSIQFGEVGSGNPPAFTFVPGFAGNDPLFVYDSDAVTGGMGELTYTLDTTTSPGAETVPEPATGIALLMLAPLGIIPRLKKQK